MERCVMWGWIAAIAKGLVSGVVGPVFDYLGKKQDVQLEGFGKAGSYDLEAYKAAVSAEMQADSLKIQANAWWGPRLLYMIVGLAFCIHASAVAIDSTFSFGWAVPKLPADYLVFERMVLTSLFVTSLVERPLSAVTAWLHRK